MKIPVGSSKKKMMCRPTGKLRRPAFGEQCLDKRLAIHAFTTLPLIDADLNLPPQFL